MDTILLITILIIAVSNVLGQEQNGNNGQMSENGNGGNGQGNGNNGQGNGGNDQMLGGNNGQMSRSSDSGNQEPPIVQRQEFTTESMTMSPTETTAESMAQSPAESIIKEDYGVQPKIDQSNNRQQFPESQQHDKVQEMSMLVESEVLAQSQELPSSSNRPELIQENEATQSPQKSKPDNQSQQQSEPEEQSPPQSAPQSSEQPQQKSQPIGRPLKVKVLVKDGEAINLSSGIGSVSIFLSPDKSVLRIRTSGGGTFSDDDTMGPYVVTNEGEKGSLKKRIVNPEDEESALKLWNEMQLVKQESSKGIAGLVAMFDGSSGVVNHPTVISQSVANGQRSQSMANGQMSQQGYQGQGYQQEHGHGYQQGQFSGSQVASGQGNSGHSSGIPISGGQYPNRQYYSGQFVPGGQTDNQWQMYQNQEQNSRSRNWERNLLIAKLAKKVSLAVVKALLNGQRQQSYGQSYGGQQSLGQYVNDDSMIDQMFDNI